MGNESTNEAPPVEESAASPPRLVGWQNWPLLLGSLIIGLVVVLALIGPSIAPRDPLEENPVIRVGDRWLTRPFPAFTPGFLLGSDREGRDLLSRLLWGIRPTLILIAVVAAVRLALGIGIGLAAGWSTRRAGQALDTLINAAITLPALMVALAIIAVIGPEIGVLAFIVGLSLTGWADTAQIVRDETRIVKSKDYIETARALGESNFQIVIRHVRRQIMPMIWMLLAFEISGTLLITANLAFLGYYVGGDVWTPVEDYEARRTAGIPELGQMLATSWTILNQVYAMFAVGSVIFATILGFNLIGEGMRQRFHRTTWPRRSGISMTLGRAGAKIEERLLLPLTEKENRALRGGLAVLAIVVIGGGFWLVTCSAAPDTRTGLSASTPEHAIALPSAGVQTTTSAPTTTARQTKVEVVWKHHEPTGFAGGPAVGPDETVYIVTKEDSLLAFGLNGEEHWRATLAAPGVGAPAVDAAGRILAADKKGGLSAFDADGDQLWHFEAEADSVGTAGPTIRGDGTIYYTVGQYVQAVAPDGEPLWKTRALDVPFYHAPSLSPSQEFLFVRDKFVNTRDGSLRVIEGLEDANQFIVGADGELYLRRAHTITRWRANPSGVEVRESATWDHSHFTLVEPRDAGVTRDRLIWLLYSTQQANTRLVWLDMEGRLLSNGQYRVADVDIVGTGFDDTLFACGVLGFGGRVTCFAFAPAMEEPLWQTTLDHGGRVTGGANAPGRLYVATGEGDLYAIGESQP